MLNIDNLMANDFYAVRNLDANTKKAIKKYATEHDLNIADALKELVTYALIHMPTHNPKKKYNSFFDTYNQITFSSNDSRFSQNIDKLLYSDKQ